MPPRSAVYVAVAGVLALAVGMGIGRFAFTPLLPMMQRDGNLSLELAGWLASANYLGYLLGALAAIWVRLPAAGMVRAALVATTVLTAAMGVTGDPLIWMLLRGAAGIASAWVLIFASGIVLGDLGARGRRGLGATVFSGVGLGTALTGCLCVAFLAMGWSAAHSWIALGVTAAILSALCWHGFPGIESATPRIVAGEGTAVPRAGSVLGFWPLILCYGCFGFGYIVPATFLPAMARDAVGDPAVFGWAWPLFGLAAFLSTLAAGRLTGRASNRRIWGVSQILLAGGVALPVLWPGIAAIATSALVVGGAFMVVTATAMQEAQRLGVAGGTRLMAAMTAAFASGQMLGPAVVSLLASGRAGLDHTLLAAAVLLAASAVAVLWRPGAATPGEGARERPATAWTR